MTKSRYARTEVATIQHTRDDRLLACFLRGSGFEHLQNMNDCALSNGDATVDISRARARA